jgi:hypothetical protein
MPLNSLSNRWFLIGDVHGIADVPKITGMARMCIMQRVRVGIPWSLGAQ